MLTGLLPKNPAAVASSSTIGGSRASESDGLGTNPVSMEFSVTYKRSPRGAGVLSIDLNGILGAPQLAFSLSRFKMMARSAMRASSRS
jgi:hypothetical protein